MLNYRLLLLSFLTYCAISCAEIVEIQNMQQLEKYVKPNALIIFDIDNTLLEPVQELGSDQWFRYQYDSHCKKGLGKQEALEKSVAEWTAIQHVTKVQVVEAGIPEIVSSLQKNHPVIGLTTRSFDMSNLTHRQLSSIHIDLAIAAPTREDIFFLNKRPNLFHEGILFTENTHKGESLRKLLAALDYRPTCIIFINDKLSHILPVEESCKKDNIPFIGLRYAYLDPKVRAFNPRIADIQFEIFGNILSSEEAQQRLKE